MVEYRTIPDVPGRYFTCAHYGLMSVAACVRNYDAGPGAVKVGRLEACVGCPIGRVHRNPLEAAAPKHTGAFAYRAICVRCRRDGEADDKRLIGRMRLVRGRTLCMSCYNREREVVRGKNAKGAPPQKWRHLFYRPVSYVQGEHRRVAPFSTPIVDWKEAALTILRGSSEHVAFVWTGSRMPGRAR